MSFRFLVALKVTGTSALKVVEILVALRATVGRNVNSHCLQDSDSSESSGYRVKKVMDPLEREILNVVDPYFSQCGGPQWSRFSEKLKKNILKTSIL